MWHHVTRCWKIRVCTPSPSSPSSSSPSLLWPREDVDVSRYDVKTLRTGRCGRCRLIPQRDLDVSVTRWKWKCLRLWSRLSDSVNKVWHLWIWVFSPWLVDVPETDQQICPGGSNWFRRESVKGTPRSDVSAVKSDLLPQIVTSQQDQKDVPACHRVTSGNR